MAFRTRRHNIIIGVCLVAAPASFIGFFACLGADSIPRWLTLLVGACGISTVVLMFGAYVRGVSEPEPAFPSEDDLKGLFSTTLTSGRGFYQELGFRPLNKAWREDYQDLYVWS